MHKSIMIEKKSMGLYVERSLSVEKLIYWEMRYFEKLGSRNIFVAHWQNLRP